MPEIQPFRGLRYRVPETHLPGVLAPPYDVITPAYQADLYARDPRNVVRLVLNRTPGEAGYAEAEETFRRWQEEELLAPDPAPSLYVLEQEFPVDGVPLKRHGLIARFRAEDPARGTILPHEQTRTAAKEDRWRLLRATRANFSPIFLMSPDADGSFTALLAEAMGPPPLLGYVDDAGVGHRLWQVGAAGLVEAFQRLLGGVKAYIADGHHRYAIALRYRDAAGPEGAWTLGYFTPMGAPGLLVLPYHRILSEGPALAEARSALAPHFRLKEVAGVEAAARAVEASLRPYAFALVDPGRAALVAESLPGSEALLSPAAAPSLRALDTYFLHEAVLGPLLGVRPEAVTYVHSRDEAEQALADARCRLAVLLRGTPVRQIVEVAEARQSMPAKSTFFHPKLPSGLVIHPLVA